MLEETVSTPLFGIALTVVFYAAAQLLNQWKRWVHPLFVTSGGVITFLLACGIPYRDYKVGGDIVTFFLGPVAVALAVPLYKSAQKLKGNVRTVVIGVTIGSVSGLLSVAILAWALEGSRDTLLSMLPKSTTSPIAIELSRQLGGSPEFGGVFAVLTGLLGSMLGPLLLRMIKVRGDIAIGTAMGTASHGIGTARLLRDSEVQGGVSGFAMGLSSIITPILCIPILWLI
ncbi:LrgB family protein [Cohnella cholangitidis]|uniref:LrgB family protein n=1 Tax=Cohnella cholangitidis TaxID=2598458 RepID=A0A7G5C1V0_9BACL|nr:LrgB family protein [Cohnella cholangitidis]QMV43184.1 LrgB family protein [Cohnella cholangitidis]